MSKSYSFEMSQQDISLSCAVCVYTTKTKRYLKRHVKVAHEGLNYQCQICDHKSTTPGNLKQHIQRIHEENSSLFDWHKNIL